MALINRPITAHPVHIIYRLIGSLPCQVLEELREEYALRTGASNYSFKKSSLTTIRGIGNYANNWMSSSRNSRKNTTITLTKFCAALATWTIPNWPVSLSTRGAAAHGKEKLNVRESILLDYRYL